MASSLSRGLLAAAEFPDEADGADDAGWHARCIYPGQNALTRRNVMYWGGGIIGLILLILLILLLTGNL
ncbi:MAG TPA: DUF3309 family protein [Gemmatimonadales bacterium]